MVRRMCFKGRCALVAVILGSLTPAPVVGQNVFSAKGEAFSFGGVSFPSVVDTFAVMRTSRYPDPRLGIVLHYLTPLHRTARLDIYVYPLQPRDSVEEDEVLRGEFDVALRDMERYASQNPERFEIISETHDSIALTDGDGRLRNGWSAEAAVRERGIQQVSFLYLFIKEGAFFKYRISYASTVDQSIRPRVVSFLSTTLAEVSVRQRGLEVVTVSAPREAERKALYSWATYHRVRRSRVPCGRNDRGRYPGRAPRSRAG